MLVIASIGTCLELQALNIYMNPKVHHRSIVEQGKPIKNPRY